MMNPGGVRVDSELIRQLGPIDLEYLNAIEYAQRCMDIYNQSLAMIEGYPKIAVNESTAESDVKYSVPIQLWDEYADV